MKPTYEDVSMMAYVRGYTLRLGTGRNYWIDDADGIVAMTFSLLIDAARWLARRPAIKPHPQARIATA